MAYAEKNDGVKIGGYGSGQINISGLTKEDEEKLLGMICGRWWSKGYQGKLLFSSGFEEPPNPVVDEEMAPFWRRPTPNQAALGQMIFDPDGVQDHSSPSIYIGSLCGYNYSPDNYRAVATKLEEYGFYCLRSRRGNDGKFWEVWYLPGFWSAQSEFKTVLEGVRTRPAKDQIATATSFLCCNVSFGTLSVVVQRAAMVLE